MAPIDEMDNEKHTSCIINLDKFGGKGSHWIGCYSDGTYTLIYDSFGRNGKDILKENWHNKLRDTEHDAEQDIAEDNCGARSMAFLFICDEYGLNLAEKL